MANQNTAQNRYCSDDNCDSHCDSHCGSNYVDHCASNCDSHCASNCGGNCIVVYVDPQLESLKQTYISEGHMCAEVYTDVGLVGWCGKSPCSFIPESTKYWIGPYGVRVPIHISVVVASDGYNKQYINGYITEMQIDEAQLMTPAVYKSTYTVLGEDGFYYYDKEFFI